MPVRLLWSPLRCGGSGSTFSFGIGAAKRAFSYTGVDRAAADAAPLIDGASSWIGVRMSFALTAWRRSPLLKETQMNERLETLKKARERMLEDRDMHAKVLAAPFDRDKAERARNKFIEIQTLIDALDRAIGGEGAH
jgi:hypothetical protein